MNRKEPLWRKANTTARGVRHLSGPEARWSRGTKAEDAAIAQGVTRGRMVQGKQRGLDYTPLYRFLLSRVGQDWPATHAEAVARLDRSEPIFHMVVLRREDGQRWFMSGENSYFSGLYVGDDNRLHLVDPDLRLEEMEPSCGCCTHTLNGKPFTRKWRPPGA